MEKIEPLEPGFSHSQIKISVNQEEQHLLDFLRDNSSDNIKKNNCIIHAYTDENNDIRGYLALSSSLIKKNQMWTLGIDQENIPSILIGKLLVDKDSRGKGIGKKLISYTFVEALRISKTIGVRLVFAHAAKNAVGFYEKLGFSIIDENKKTTTMAIDLLNMKEMYEMLHKD